MHLLAINSLNFLSSVYVLVFTSFLKDIFTWCCFLGSEFFQNFVTVVLFLVLASNEKSSPLHMYYTICNTSVFLWLLLRYFFLCLVSGAWLWCFGLWFSLIIFLNNFYCWSSWICKFISFNKFFMFSGIIFQIECFFPHATMFSFPRVYMGLFIFLNL